MTASAALADTDPDVIKKFMFVSEVETGKVPGRRSASSGAVRTCGDSHTPSPGFRLQRFSSAAPVWGLGDARRSAPCSGGAQVDRVGQVVGCGAISPGNRHPKAISAHPVSEAVVTHLVTQAAHALSFHSSLNDLGRHLHRHVFPDPKGRPASRSEKEVCLLIPATVAGDLVGPVLGIRTGNCVMLWAAMPEATINENGYSLPRKHNVCGAP